MEVIEVKIIDPVILITVPRESELEENYIGKTNRDWDLIKIIKIGDDE